MVNRFDPFRELDRLASALDGSANASVPMDVVRSAHEVRIYFDLPGIDPGSVDLSVERNRLTLKVTRSWEIAEGERVVVRERPSGDFSRTLMLSEGLDASRVTARYEHGVLLITIPVGELAQPRKITIGGVEATQPVEAHDGAAHNGVTVGASAN
jgi:HSP20 family protein